jgi:3-dehydroquinate dehydratase type I
MIYISLADISFEECLESVRKFDFIEIRLDLLKLSRHQITEVFSANPNLIATCRPGKHSEEEQKALLLHAVESGAAYVDVEVEASDTFKTEIINAAREKGCQLIISYHDFEKTPERAELEHIITWCLESNPDIIKIACMVNSERDNARLLGLLDTEKRMLVIGMGEKGKITRVIAPFLGSFCTFAAYFSGKATAPGQFSKDEIETLHAFLKDYRIST